MEKIPEISFSSSTQQIEGFEAINFVDLLERNPAFDEKGSIRKHDPFKPHRLRFFAVILLTGGQVNHVVDFETYTLQAGDCLIIAKNQIHAFDQNKGYEGYLLVFTEAFLQKYVAQASLVTINRLYDYFIGQNIFHSPEDVNIFSSIIEKEFMGAPALTKANIAGAFLTIFLLKLVGLKAEGQLSIQDTKYYEYFNAFRKRVETKYTQTRDAKDYAEDLLISYKHLNTCCKKVTHQTAKSFIDNYVILEAKRKLVATTLSAKEISYQCGFDEPTNFLKYFKKHTNQTPTEFRKSLA